MTTNFLAVNLWYARGARICAVACLPVGYSRSMNSLTGPSTAIWVQQLTEKTQPLLTWYSTGRVELAGPVLSRWVAKVDNFLSDQFPFDGQTYALVLPDCWQKTVWQAGLMLRGWEESEPDAADLVVGDDLDVLGEAASGGAISVAQPTDPLGLTWDGELPPGVVDAPGELMALADEPVDPLDSGPLWPTETSLLAGIPVPPGRVFLQTPDTGRMLQIWSNGGSVVIIDDWNEDQPKTQQLLEQEQADQVLA